MSEHGKSDQSQRAFFGRRKGHPLRPRQAALFDTLLPRIGIDTDKPAPADLRVLFADASEVRLEIGFGGAEHLITQAKADPGVGFIGSDAFINGVGKALAAIEENKLANVRLHFGDASALIDRLPAASLARIDLLYPDPWPKRRHWKRRFIQNEFARALGARFEERRRTALRHRHRRLCGLCAGARTALEGFRMDRRARR